MSWQIAALEKWLADIDDGMVEDPLLKTGRRDGSLLGIVNRETGRMAQIKSQFQQIRPKVPQRLVHTGSKLADVLTVPLPTRRTMKGTTQVVRVGNLSKPLQVRSKIEPRVLLTFLFSSQLPNACEVIARRVQFSHHVRQQ